MTDLEFSVLSRLKEARFERLEEPVLPHFKALLSKGLIRVAGGCLSSVGKFAVLVILTSEGAKILDNVAYKEPSA